MDEKEIRKHLCERCVDRLDAARALEEALARVSELKAKLGAKTKAQSPRPSKPSKPTAKKKPVKAVAKRGGIRKSVIPDSAIIRYINGHISTDALAKKYKTSTQNVYVRAATMRKRFGIPSKHDARAKRRKLANGKSAIDVAKIVHQATA